MKTMKRVISALLSVVMVLTLIFQNATLPVFAVAANNIKENTYYVIVSKKSGKAITVDSYATGNGATIVQETLNNYESQIWTFDERDDGYFVIVNHKSGKAMDIPWSSTEAGVQVEQFDKNNGDNQQWVITDVADGYCRISPKLAPEMALNVKGNSNDDGAEIIQWGFSGASNELWEIREVTDIVANPEMEEPDVRLAVDKYIEKFFYIENGLGKLKNEPSNGFWTDAEILEVFIDAYEQLGDEKYKTYVKAFYDGIINRRSNDWAWNEYNDDVMWMVIACTRAYLLTGDQTYLTSAKNNFKMCYDRAWDETVFGGGLWWRTDNNTKNACVNGPGAIAACLLGDATGDESYYTKAKAMIDWEYEHLFNANTGAVSDSKKADGTVSTWASTYNQGTFIGACTMLYKHYKDNKYFNAANLAAKYSSGMGDGTEGYLNREQNSGDLIGFKGILGRWLGYFARELGVTDYNDWMYRNSVAAWNNRNNDNLMWTTFGRTTPENIEVENANEVIDGTTTTKASYAAWGCSAAVAWLLGTPKQAAVAEGDWVTTSPDGATAMSVNLNNEGHLTYSVIQDGQRIVDESDLGIITSIGDFTKNLQYKKDSQKTINETYSVLSGKKSEYTNYCVEKTITLTSASASNVEFDVVTRAYNDGVAFRYVIRTGNNREMTISPNNEKTSFVLPAGSTLWYMDRTERSFMYEEDYLESSIDSLPSAAQPTFPMLYKSGQKYALITEADKHGNYVGSLTKNEGNRTLRTIFDLTQTSNVKTTAPFTSPWRTVIVGDESAIINNTMVENLSPAPNTSYNFNDWVEPGVSSWSWVSYYGGQEDPEIHKKFIDLAASMGWTYYILDEKWQPGSNTSGSRYEGMWDWFEDVRQHAEDKGVKLIAWVDKSDVDTDAEREARFKEWSEAGIVGIKVDFFYNESQAMLQLHDDIYADAAKYKLLVNVHGSNPTSGEIRTYPNVIAREAIKGQEQGGITANQYTLIPFIRAAIGTADVTEQLYSRDTGKTSMGFQIALSTLVENGIRSMGGKPEDYYAIPEAVSYYKNFPAKWDDLALINSQVGSYINIARKTGNSWYAAGISVDARTMTYTPDFLDADKTYTAIIYKENGNSRTDLEMIVQNNVSRTTVLSVPVQAGGGYAIKLVPQDGNSLQAINTSLTNIKVQANYTADIKVSFVPDDTKLTDIVWTVEDGAIAKVDATPDGATIKGLKVGRTNVIATSSYDNSIRRVISVEVTPALYELNTDIWSVLNNNYKYLIEDENTVTITAENGVINNNVFAMKVPEGDTNFEITAKISGGLMANYQGGFIGVFNPNNLGGNYVSVGRRYHSMFNTGGENANNHFAMMSNNTEFYSQDAIAKDAAYVRLVKQGNQFIGYYRANENDAWTQVTSDAANSITNTNLANSNNLYVGFYAGAGGTTNGIDVTVEDFTYNGTKINFANYNADVESDYVMYGYEGEAGTLSNGAGSVNADACSNGQYAGNIGGETRGTAKFTVYSDVASPRKMNIYYATATERTLNVVVNGVSQTVICPATGGWGIPNVVPIEIKVILEPGVNVIEFTGVSGAVAPNMDKFQIQLNKDEIAETEFINGAENYTTFAMEAENAVLTGGANIVNAEACSNGQYAGGIGAGGIATFNLNADSAGQKELKIYYATYTQRQISVMVNGNNVGNLTCPGTGGWGIPSEQPQTIYITLNEGANTIELSGVDTAYAPNVDKIEIVGEGKITVVNEEAPTETTTEAATTVAGTETPGEVFGAVVGSNAPGIITVVWGYNPDIYKGETYNVYIDGEKKLSNVTCASYDIDNISGGNHEVKITAVLNNIETAGVTLNVSVEAKSEPNVVVEINGYQISTTTEGFRTVYSISDPDSVVEQVGMIYGLTDYISEADMVVGSNNPTVFNYAATESGKMDSPISNMDSSYSYTMTMRFIKSSAFYSAGISVRAYAKLIDGTYIYSDINNTSVYKIAEELYTKVSMNTVEAHNYLYDNIIALVTPDYKPIDFNWSNTIIES